MAANRRVHRTALLSAALLTGVTAPILTLAGPAAAAVPGLVVVKASSPINSLDKTVTVSCPAGTRVLSAGGDTSLGVGVVMDDIRFNFTSVTVAGYEVDPTAQNWRVSAIAACAPAPAGLLQVSATSLTNSLDKSVTATCPAGKKLIGTGGEINGALGEVVMDDLRPNGSPTVAPTSVTVSGYEDSAFAENWSITAYAVCADPLPGLMTVSGATGSDSNNKGTSVNCPAGKVLTGGGWAISGGSGEVLIRALLFHETVDTNGPPVYAALGAEEEDPYGTNWSVRGYAICASA